MANRTEVEKAWYARKRKTAGNHRTDGTTYWLFGHAIARWAEDGVAEFTTAGYNTLTTRSTLLMLGAGVRNVQAKDGRPVLAMCGQLWEHPTSWTRVGLAGPDLDPPLPEGWTYLQRASHATLLRAVEIPHVQVTAAPRIVSTSGMFSRAAPWGNHIAAPRWVAEILTHAKGSRSQMVRALRTAARDESKRTAFGVTVTLGHPSIDVLL